MSDSRLYIVSLVQEFIVDLHARSEATLGQRAYDVEATLDDDQPPPFLSAAGLMSGRSGDSGGPGEAPRASCEKGTGDGAAQPPTARDVSERLKRTRSGPRLGYPAV